MLSLIHMQIVNSELLEEYIKRLYKTPLVPEKALEVRKTLDVIQSDLKGFCDRISRNPYSHEIMQLPDAIWDGLSFNPHLDINFIHIYRDKLNFNAIAIHNTFYCAKTKNFFFGELMQYFSEKDIQNLRDHNSRAKILNQDLYKYKDKLLKHKPFTIPSLDSEDYVKEAIMIEPEGTHGIFSNKELLLRIKELSFFIECKNN